MKVGAIFLLIAVIGFFIFETVSLVMTIIKKKKEKKGATVVSEYDYFNELIHSCDFSQYTKHKKLREAVQSDVSFRDLFANGFIPVQQIGQYNLAYNLLKYGDMYYDKTDRNGRSGHEIPVNTVEEVL